MNGNKVIFWFGYLTVLFLVGFFIYLFLPHQAQKPQNTGDKTAMRSLILPTMAPTPETPKPIPASFFITPDTLKLATEAGEVALVSGKETFALYNSKTNIPYNGREIKNMPLNMAALSPDKSKVVIVVDNILSKPYLFYADLKSEEIVNYKPIGGVELFTWSPDSRYILYSVGNECGPSNSILSVFDTKSNQSYSLASNIPGVKESETTAVVYDSLAWTVDSKSVKFHYKVVNLKGCEEGTTIKQGNHALTLPIKIIEEK